MNLMHKANRVELRQSDKPNEDGSFSLEFWLTYHSQTTGSSSEGIEMVSGRHRSMNLGVLKEYTGFKPLRKGSYSELTFKHPNHGTVTLKVYVPGKPGNIEATITTGDYAETDQNEMHNHPYRHKRKVRCGLLEHEIVITKAAHRQFLDAMNNGTLKIPADRAFIWPERADKPIDEMLKAFRALPAAEDNFK